MSTYLKYIRPYFKKMTVGLFIKFTGTVMDLLLPYILAHMIDHVVGRKKIKEIVFFGVLMLIASVIAVVCNVAANRMAARVAKDTTQSMRHDLFVKTTNLSCSQVDSFTIPSLEARLTTDTYNVHQMTGMMQRLGVRAPILLIGGIIITSIMEPVLTLVLLSVLPFITAAVIFISKKGVRLYSKLQEATDNMVRVTRENIQGIRIIKALSKTDHERRNFRRVNHDLMQREKTAGITMAMTDPLMNIFLNIGLVSVIVVGAYRVNQGVSEVGKIIAFMSYFSLILNAMLTVTRMFVMYSKGAASVNRIASVLDMPQELPVADAEADRVKVSDVPHIEFRHVSFSYKGNKNNLTDINFKLSRGETLGIIGATGSGKTTIAALLTRFYDVTSGSVLINGRDIRSIPYDELYAMFGCVLQNDFLFADTVSENIRFGRDIDDEALVTAAKNAQAFEFIAGKDEGMQHQLAIKGANLSGGQKQRILIARALASKPDLLILDDSSSALDYKTDSALRASIAANFKNSTKIIIAQRISSIQSAEKIIVTDGGKMIDSGTHDELIARCDVYMEIAESQMGGVIIE